MNTRLNQPQAPAQHALDAPRTGPSSWPQPALLACVGLPALGRASSRSEQAVCVNNLRQIGRAYAQWGISHDGLPPQAGCQLADGGTSPRLLRPGWRPRTRGTSSPGSPTSCTPRASWLALRIPNASRPRIFRPSPEGGAAPCVATQPGRQLRVCAGSPPGSARLCRGQWTATLRVTARRPGVQRRFFRPWPPSIT